MVKQSSNVYYWLSDMIKTEYQLNKVCKNEKCERHMWNRFVQDDDYLLLRIEKQKSYVLTKMQSMT